MEPLHLPISDVVVAIELPCEHLVLLARYLTAANGKDRRLRTFIRNPRKYGAGLVARRVRALAEHPEETAAEMTEQMGVWLRFARHAPTGHEPTAGDVTEWYLSGSIRGFAGILPDLTDGRAREVRRAAYAVLGHACGNAPGCLVCDAAARGRWNDVFEITRTDPELVLELYRNFRAAGYPGIPTRTSEFEVDF